jgi:hypothetical protein
LHCSRQHTRIEFAAGLQLPGTVMDEIAKDSEFGCGQRGLQARLQ